MSLRPKAALVVSVPGAPTGLVFNGDASAFVITDGTVTAGARQEFQRRRSLRTPVSAG